MARLRRLASFARSRARSLARSLALPAALTAIAFGVAIGPAEASLFGQDAPVLHEPIPPDPREDLAMHVALAGDLPAAIQTPSGVVGAPDPQRPPAPGEPAYTGSERDSFVPDRDTRRPEVSAYDDPFTPSTAPFKRLQAFDAVKSDYRLYVRDERLVSVGTGGAAGAGDEAFYADMIVDVGPGRLVRIPSVGPGARVLRARLGLEGRDMDLGIVRDGADNWFLQSPSTRSPARARLVMELAITRATFGGQIADPSWRDLPIVAPLPENVARDAAEVRAAIGVSRSMRPREAIARMVQYFRGFADSDDPPRGRGSVYLDLAMSKKGVCRHRAFAFLITAESLGVPTRMALNEAHAWVEVHDGTLWRRIDLGGAGHMEHPNPELAERPAYEPPPDPFDWPQGSERGDDMIADAHARAAAGGPGAGAGPSPASSAGNPAASAPGAPSAAPNGPSGAPSSLTSPTSPTSPVPGAAAAEHDDRSPATVSLTVVDSDAHRGSPLPVKGVVRADGEPCAHVSVDLVLRDARTQRAVAFGTLATGDDGAFAGGIVIPTSTPLGDYDVMAHTTGDGRCGAGSN